MNKIKDFLQQELDIGILDIIIPRLVVEIAAVTFVIIVYKNGLTYDQFIKVLDIIIWPLVFFVLFLFFQKIFTYFFFSFEEFNFFGAKGRLKNVQEIVLEKAHEFNNKEREKEEALSRVKSFEERMTRSGKTIEGTAAIAREFSKRNEELLRENKKLEEKLSLLEKVREEDWNIHIETMKEALSIIKKEQDELKVKLGKEL